MGAADGNLFRRAFELAYFIHPQTPLALRIAESALHKLEHSFGRQERRTVYIPSGRRQGDSPARALRTKVSLSQEHLLQFLIYAESDHWERSSEQGASSHRVTEDDMVIRFVKHLVQITLKRNSFYVALGLGRLLYEYETSQVRGMYDVLMQDQARFRDNSYLRRQKNALMRELTQRFDRLIRIVRTAQREDRFQIQPTTEPLLRLVNECLVRFTPWETACVFPESHDATGKIPALAFTGLHPDDESPVEVNRIHTILHPDCFSRLVASLGFAAPSEMLAVPQFFIGEENEPRGDRFNPPNVPDAVSDRLRRSLAERARRRKAFRAELLRVYVDDVGIASFDPARDKRVSFTISITANLIEVRGDDHDGELTLAILIPAAYEIAEGGVASDSLTLEGGQKFTVTLKPQATETDEAVFNVAITYTEKRSVREMTRSLFAWESNNEVESDRKLGPLKPAYVWLLGIAALIAVIGLVVLWQRTRPREVFVPDRRVEVIATPTPGGFPQPTVSRSPERQPSPADRASDIARASWSTDPTAIDRAIRIELTRGGAPAIEVSDPAKLQLAVNRVDANNESYRRYRINVIAQGQVSWERILQAPAHAGGRAHVMNLELSLRQLPAAESYQLRLDGETQNGWENLGVLVLNRKSRYRNSP